MHKSSLHRKNDSHLSDDTTFVFNQVLTVFPCSPFLHRLLNPRDLIRSVWSKHHPLPITSHNTHSTANANAPVWTSPKTVDSRNTVLQKISGAIFCTQFVQCNDGGAGDKCMFLSVFTYSSNPLTQICEIVQLTMWAHRKFTVLWAKFEHVLFSYRGSFH